MTLLQMYGNQLNLESAEKLMAGLTGLDRKGVERVEAIARPRRFFHWDLEFPECFFGLRPGTERQIDHRPPAEAGFDAIVGNPPYVRQESLKQDKDYFSTAFASTYDATCDLYVYFMEREIEVLRSGGLMGMIVANKWLRAGYGKKLRGYLLRRAQPVSLVDFGHSPIFPDADTFPCVPIFSRRAKPLSTKDVPDEGETMAACQFPRDDYSPNAPIGTYVNSRRQKVPTQLLRVDGWSVEDPRVQVLLEKFHLAGTTLKDYLHAIPIRGTVTGCNEAFFIDETKRAELIAQHAGSAELLRPLLRGRDVDRWQTRTSGLYVIVVRRGTDIGKYPAVKKHLLKFKARLEPCPHDWDNARDGNWHGRAAGDYAWYELQASPSDEFVRVLESPKIVYQEIQYHSWFALETDGAYPNNKAFMLPTSDPVLLAILNSPLMWWNLTRTMPHMKDEALTPSGCIMEGIRVCVPDAALRAGMTTAAQALLQLARNQHASEGRILTKLAETLDASDIDRRCLLWVRRPDDDFLRLVQGAAGHQLTPAAKADLVKFRHKASDDLGHFLTEQLKLEKQLAVFVEDAYGLSAEERALLRATRPVRDPIDVLEARLAGLGQEMDAALESS